MVIHRRLRLDDAKHYLLLGPRRVGKSTLLKTTLPTAEVVDLLQTDVYYDYVRTPSLLRQRFSKLKGTLTVDEVQRVPDLIHEVHWLIENTRVRVVVSGSSARKLRRGGVTNLAGRLRTARLFPLTWSELKAAGHSIELKTLLQFGGLPPVVLDTDKQGVLDDYCGEYLREEVSAEGLVRNVGNFTRFLEIAALSNTALLNFASVARDVGVSAKTVQEYFQILEDTLLAYMLEPFVKTKKRRAIRTPKLYFFDCGLPNTLLRRILSDRTPEYGQSFEQFCVLEALAAQHYDKTFGQARYFRSASGYEVDLVLDDHTGIEFKTGRVHESDTRGLIALSEDVKLKRRWVVCTESQPRTLANGVEVVPWQLYCAALANGLRLD